VRQIHLDFGGARRGMSLNITIPLRGMAYRRACHCEPLETTERSQKMGRGRDLHEIRKAASIGQLTFSQPLGIDGFGGQLLKVWRLGANERLGGELARYDPHQGLSKRWLADPHGIGSCNRCRCATLQPSPRSGDPPRIHPSQSMSYASSGLPPICLATAI